MQKRYKIGILALFVMLVCSLVFVVYLKVELAKYHTTLNIIGTFKPDSNNPLNTEYIVFEKDDIVVWYRADSPYSTPFYEQGVLKKISDENVYKVVFDNKDIHIIYYEDSIMLIDDEFAYSYIKTDNHPSYTGVKPPQR